MAHTGAWVSTQTWGLQITNLRVWRVRSEFRSASICEGELPWTSPERKHYLQHTNFNPLTVMMRRKVVRFLLIKKRQQKFFLITNGWEILERQHMYMITVHSRQIKSDKHFCLKGEYSSWLLGRPSWACKPIRAVLWVGNGCAWMMQGHGKYSLIVKQLFCSHQY